MEKRQTSARRQAFDAGVKAAGRPHSASERQITAEYFCSGDWMTQISLKLFYKMPFARDDIGGLSEGSGARLSCVCVTRCIYVGILDKLSKGEPAALGPRLRASLPFFVADHDPVVSARCQI